MLRLSELKLPLDHREADLEAAVCRRLRLEPHQLQGLRLVKRSVDARKPQAIALVYSLDLELALDARAEARLLKRFAGDPHLRPSPDTTYQPVAIAAGRSVYSFCMCPGGLVVGATSEEGRVVTNGMSQHTRNERNANSGIVVTVELADLLPYGEGPEDPLAGVAFQRHWEARAFAAGGSSYRAPAQRVGDFLAHRPSLAAAQGVEPSYQPGVQFGGLDDCLPEFVLTAIREALPAFARRIPGFLMDDALLTGVETRTSSPVRLPRDGTTLECCNTPGLYPAGEGAGYAGGILSAAIDGIKVAEQVALAITPPRLQPPGAPGGSACDPA